MERTSIPSVLACDVGNSAVHLAAVEGEKVSEVRRFAWGDPTGLGETLEQVWKGLPNPKKVVAASVNPEGLARLEQAVSAGLRQSVLVVGRDLPLPIQTDLSHPESIGVDRLCAAVAAFDRLGVACVVADFGTAITIDCVSDEGRFLGGAILPGLSMGAEALSGGTAQLPRVELSAPDWVFGRDTRQAIVGGLVFGARGALRELTESYATAIGHWPLVIVTGGDAAVVCPDPHASELVQAVVPDLVLRGVAAAYYRTLLR